MKNVLQRNGHWIVAFGGLLGLAFAVGVITERQSTWAAPPAGRADHATAQQGLADARAMSTVFRDVAKEALPAIVSIETRGKAARVASDDGEMQGLPFGDDSPFGELFRNDPRLRELFKNRSRTTPRTHGMGSGFIIDPAGIVLTNNHVVDNAEQVKVRLSDGREFVAEEVKTDTRTDVAILRIHADGKLPALRLGNSDAVEVGDWVLAVGSPFGLDLTVTAGIISAKGRGPGITEREDFLQTDAAINPGNSGGPLLNLNGEVIGMNTAISTRSGGYDGVGFAVPVNIARWVADQLVQNGSVSRAYLGVGIQAVDNQIAEQLHVPVGRGAIVNLVSPNSPAAAAKIETGDLILKLDGKEVTTPHSLQGIVERLRLGATYPMVVLRNGKEVTLNVEMKEMPKDYTRANFDRPVEEPQPAAGGKFAELGLEIADLTPEVARQLGDPNAAGVLISSVKEDGLAANAGLREGMIIEKVGSRPVRSPHDFRTALKDLSLEKGILMLVRTPRGGTHFVVLRQETATPQKK